LKYELDVFTYNLQPVLAVQPATGKQVTSNQIPATIYLELMTFYDFLRCIEKCQNYFVMKIPFRFLMPLIVSLLIISCKKTETLAPTLPPPVDPPVAYKTKEISIVLPEGVKIDLASSTVHSLSVSTKVDENGKSKAAFNKGYPHIAYVFDKDNRLMMAGFLTDTSATISAASTARVLLYFGYATMMEQYNLSSIFINEIDQVKGTKEWYASFENLFKTDPLALDKGSFAAPLRAAIKKISAGRKMNPVLTQPMANPGHAKKGADINIKDNAEKSGLLVHANDLSKISFDNKFRRRAHAFLYKVKSKTEKGAVTEKTIESTSIAEVDTIIDPVGGFTSFNGVLGAWIEGKEMEYARLTSGPAKIELNDDEEEVEYKLRIVGPGIPGTNKTISNQEIAKLTQLEIETLALDFLLPVMLEVVGNKDDLALIDGSRHVSGPVEDFLEGATAALKIIPGAYDEVRKGNYDMALRKLLEGMYSELNAAMFEKMVKLTGGILEIIAQQRYYIPANADVFKEAGRKVKILKLIDLGLFANDIARMGTHIAQSSQLEEWIVTARAPRVTLLSDKTEVVPLEQTKIKCEIKNFKETGGDTHAFFEWSTSGKYGKISDTKGHTNLASFNSADHEIFYYSNAKLSDLTDGDNLEYIYVVAKFGSTVLGRDTIVINVKKETATFTLSLTPNTNIIERVNGATGRKEWTCANPFYTAEFKHRTGAKSYSIRIIRKDGTKGNPTLYYPVAPNVIDGTFKYRLGIGPIRIVITESEKKRDEEEAFQLKQLADVGHTGIEVTVNY
jgi:hypothetical protein